MMCKLSLYLFNKSFETVKNIENRNHARLTAITAPTPRFLLLKRYVYTKSLKWSQLSLKMSRSSLKCRQSTGGLIKLEPFRSVPVRADGGCYGSRWVRPGHRSGSRDPSERYWLVDRKWKSQIELFSIAQFNLFLLVMSIIIIIYFAQ